MSFEESILYGEAVFAIFYEIPRRLTLWETNGNTSRCQPLLKNIHRIFHSAVSSKGEYKALRLYW